MNAQWTDAKTWHHLPAKDWEVRAMLAGAKTEIVRPAKWPLWADPEEHGPLLAQSPTGIAYYWDGKPTRHMTCPYGLPGDGIYIREAWAPGDLIFDNHESDPPRWVWYRADDSPTWWTRTCGGRRSGSRQAGCPGNSPASVASSSRCELSGFKTSPKRGLWRKAWVG